TQLPALQKVLVAFGDNIAFEPTLDEALDVLFKGDSGATAGDTGVEPGNGPTPTPTPGETNPPTSESDQYQQALQDAKQAMLDRDAALKAGDRKAFAEADDRLTAAVETLIALGDQEAAGVPSGGQERVPDQQQGDEEAGELVHPEEPPPAPRRDRGGV